MNKIGIERFFATIAAIETIAINNKKVLESLGITVEEVLTVCQYARKAWFDMNGGVK